MFSLSASQPRFCCSDLEYNSSFCDNNIPFCKYFHDDGMDVDKHGINVNEYGLEESLQQCLAPKQISSQQQPELLLHVQLVPHGIPLISEKLTTIC